MPYPVYNWLCNQQCNQPNPTIPVARQTLPEKNSLQAPGHDVGTTPFVLACFSRPDEQRKLWGQLSSRAFKNSEPKRLHHRWSEERPGALALGLFCWLLG